MLNIDPSLIVNEVTPNTPEQGSHWNVYKHLYFRLFSGLLTASYFCNTTTPTTPTLTKNGMVSQVL
jgi:hypothetical protein